MKNTSILILTILFLLMGCAGTASKTNQLNLGMTKSQVIEVMGEPTSSHATDGVEYMVYRLTAGSTAGTNAGCAALALITFGIAYTKEECSGGQRIDYFAQFKEGKLISYGKVGDFNSTKNPALDLNINNKNSSK
jgi:hypothetical protein